MLWLCIRVPGSTSSAAKPITVLYLRIGSPLRIARTAILCPAGTSSRGVTPSLGSAVPAGVLARAATALSFGSRRMNGCGTDIGGFLCGKADGPRHELAVARAELFGLGLFARG